MARTVVVGLDSVDWFFLSRAIDMGVAGNIESVCSNGFHGELRSIDPPLSVPAWLCFSTGKRPDKLDLYNFRMVESGSYSFSEMPDCGRFQSDAFWTNLDNVGVLGVPTIFPSSDLSLDGFMFSGPFVPDKGFPEEVGEKARRHGYTANVPNLWKYDECLEHLDMEGDFASKVLQDRNPEFFISVSSVTDRLQHSYRDDEQKMMELYSKADDYVGKILEHFDEEDNVFIVSDHGSAEIKKVFYINTWLEDEDLLSLNQGAKKLPKIKEKARYRLKKTAKHVLSSLGLLDFALDNVPENIQDTVKEKTDIWDKIDWNNTKAFATGGYVGQIYINTEEYPEGCVTEEEYNEVRNRIIDKLEELEDPETGEEVVEKAWKKEDVYREELTERAPDIMFYTSDMSYKVNDGFHGKIFDKSVPNGSHGLNGVILGRGPDIKQGAEVDMHLTDVAPTLLHLMGEKVPEDMDGAVKKQIFEQGSDPEKREVEYVSEDLQNLDF
jgi:predicted AlkP superfamily phosphohydrolase/phosphomutase